MGNVAKRFTDTEKWKKKWFRELPAHLKAFWGYLCDVCDHAGIWSVDFEAASYFIGKRITAAEFQRHFGDRALWLADDKVFLPGFVEFQYGQLRPDCKPHQAVINALRRYGIDPVKLTVPEGYPKGIQTLKDKDKEKDKDQDKEEGGLGETNALDFEAVWQDYPRKIDKAEARDRFERLITTSDDYAMLRQAIAHYRKYTEDRGTESAYIKHLATFLGTEKKQRWREWVEGCPEGEAPGGINWDRVFGDDEQAGGPS